MSEIKVSIIMGIYNCDNTIEEAIDSILKQSFKDWELIMCDDGSTDKTYEKALKYADNYENIFLYKNDKNLGLNKTLNKCLSYARGKYIARMDGDDISLQERLEIEFKFLENNKSYDIVSTPMIFFNEAGQFGTSKSLGEPTPVSVMKGTPFCHAPCMVRKEAYEAVNGYSTKKITLRVEDYDMWVRMLALGFKGINLDIPLYKMRDDLNAYKRRKFKYRINEAYVKLKAFKYLKPPFYTVVYVFRPIIVGMLPRSIYDLLHRKNINR